MSVDSAPPIDTQDASTVPIAPPMPGPIANASPKAAMFRDRAAALLRGEMRSVT